jgi:hypothetical protein
MGALLAGIASHEDALLSGLAVRLGATHGAPGAALGMVLYMVCHGAAALTLSAAAAQIKGDSDTGMGTGLIAVLLLAASAVVGLGAADPLALVMATGGGFALAMGLPLAAVCWFPWLTGRGILAGMIAAIAAVLATEGLDTPLIPYGLSFPWGRWPLTLHSAGWALIAGTVVTVVVSAITQNRDAYARRAARHQDFGNDGGPAPGARALIPAAWIATAVWFFFGMGPGAIIGNNVFGSPTAGTPDGWTFGIPSIWAWQILFWAFGVVLLWFLAYRLELSTFTRERIDALNAEAVERDRNKS